MSCGFLMAEIGHSGMHVIQGTQFNHLIDKKLCKGSVYNCIM